MDLESKKVVTTTTAGGGGGVVAGSVWESRMRTDEVKGGIKVFNENQSPQETSPSDQNNSSSNGEIQVYKRMRPKQSVLDSGVSGAKRKTWKSDNSDASKRSPVQISKQRSEKEKTLDENCKELSVSDLDGGGIKKSPAQIKKSRSELVGKELSASVDGFEGSPIHRMRTRAMWKMLSGEGSAERKNSLSLRKLKSEPSKSTGDGIEFEGNVGLRKAKSEKVKALDEEISVELRKGIEKSPNGIKESGSVESLDVFGAGEEKEITTNLDNVVGDQVNYTPKVEETDEDDDWDMEEAVGEDEFENASDKKSIVVKEMNVSGEKLISLSVISDKKIQQRNERAASISTIVRKHPPSAVNHARIFSNPTNTKPFPQYDEPQKVSKTHSKLQSLVELVMWRDVSKSAFIFGLGTFSIISSSYTKDLNISFISVISYLGLVYLAAIFLFRSIINRGVLETDDTDQGHVVREEEAIWALKLILPYLDEFLLTVRALFSGDPATTMKLAVLLFILARCGSSITIWKMAKLGFFGIFTVPKVCSSYSTQLTAYGTFWIRRFRDAWMSCTHKKGVAFAIFTVVWNLSSVVARIWAVFMLFVAFKYYQQSMVKEEWVQEEEEEGEATVTGGERGGGQGQVGGRIRHGRSGPTLIENSRKLKKKL